MGAHTSYQLDSFRKEIGDFLDASVDERLREAGRKTTSMFSPFDETMAFQKLLHQRGWSGFSWPTEYGGTGWSITQQRIFHEECRKRELPHLLPNALQMVGPAIMEYGTEEQKQRYLPLILSGDDYWAQGYSEPNAGSDLVALKCRADRDGDDYVINGSKIWTTYAHHSNRLFLLVKTGWDCKPQRGITFLLLDSLEIPGMEVRPIIGLDGMPEQCEVFFNDVRVPVSSRLGEENDGWSVAKYLLQHERGGGTSSAAVVRQELEHVKRLAATLGDGRGGKLIDSSLFQDRYTRLYLETVNIESTEIRISNIEMGSPEAGPLSSMLKINWTETLQRVCEFSVEVSGSLSLPLQLEALAVSSDVEPIGTVDELTVMPRYLNNFAASIYGGTNEIQRDIIANALLGR